MNKTQFKEVTYTASRLYALCHELFPGQFDAMFTSSPTQFKEWINSKTGLNLDHRCDKFEAMKGWIDALEGIKYKRRRKQLK